MISINPYNKNNSPSFTASLVKKVPILQYNKAVQKYIPYEADFIKFDSKCQNDLKNVEKICFNDRFVSLGKYLFNMWTNIKWKFPSVKSNSLYGLVLPNDTNYDSLGVNDILGVTEFVENFEEQENRIMFMITNKDYRKKCRTDNSEYSYIGTGMTNALKELYPQKPMSVFAECDAIEFWQKQGFKNITQRKLIYNG